MPNTTLTHLGGFTINFQTGEFSNPNIYSDNVMMDQKYPHTCMKCNRAIVYRQAYIHAINKGLTDKEFKALWTCDIVEFLCCSCFYGRSTGRISDVLDAMNHVFIALNENEWNREYEQNPIR